MEYILEVDKTWPPDYEPIGISNGRLAPLDQISTDQSIGFQSAGSTTIATPGWVNAHSHLELTDCPSIQFDGNFVDWIEEVLEFKLSLDKHELIKNYKSGSQQLLKSGVCHVVDHCDKTDWIIEALPDLSLSVFLLKELIAFTETQIKETREAALDFIQNLQDRRLKGGLAPHAPYSAHPDIFQFVDNLKDSQDLIESAHIHEVQGEIEFAESATGPFADLLEERTGLQPDSPYPCGRPLQDLVSWGYLASPLFGIHMNYMNQSDYRWLESSEICPVFCPRSYNYFNHDTKPIEAWIQREIPFAIGTDSVASNKGLNLLSELEELFQIINSDLLSVDSVLKALTVNPTRVIGQPDRGVLTLGTPADISIFEVPGGSYSDLIRGRAEPLAVINDGNIVWSDEEKITGIT